MIVPSEVLTQISMALHNYTQLMKRYPCPGMCVVCPCDTHLCVQHDWSMPPELYGFCSRGQVTLETLVGLAVTVAGMWLSIGTLQPIHRSKARNMTCVESATVLRQRETLLPIRGITLYSCSLTRILHGSSFDGYASRPGIRPRTAREHIVAALRGIVPPPSEEIVSHTRREDDDEQAS